MLLELGVVLVAVDPARSLHPWTLAGKPQDEDAAVRPDEGVEPRQFERSGDLLELVADELRVDGAHERAVRIDELLVEAGDQPHREIAFVDVRFESCIVKMLVQCIELVDGVIAQVVAVIEIGFDGAQHRSAGSGVAGAALGLWVVLGAGHGGVAHRGSTAPAGFDGSAHDEALLFEDAQVIAGGVDVEAGIVGESSQLLTGLPVHSLQQSEAAHLCEPPVVIDPARHAVSVGFWRARSWGSAAPRTSASHHVNLALIE